MIVEIVECFLGIIPALAGNTIHACCAMVHLRDHPRACGEHNRGAVGSNSTMWIIPALAGNTPLSRTRPWRRRDHPRACGEHPKLLFLVGVFGGSSPRLRGTPNTSGRILWAIGIIPALAGNTWCTCPTRTWTRDHPRACGEHLTAAQARDWDQGSSPRLRGPLPLPMVT